MKKTCLILLVLIGFTNCQSFFEPDISDDKVKILVPATNTEIDAGNISFSWEAIDGAENYKFQIVSPNFKTATKLVKDTVITSNKITISLGKGMYEWRVQGRNAEYETEFTLNVLNVK